jgi:hypothetical protein
LASSLILSNKFKSRSILSMSTAQILIVLALGWIGGGLIVAMLIGRVFRSADLEPEDSPTTSVLSTE